MYNSLKGYPVDDQGNNIFYYLLEPELLAKLENDGDPSIQLAGREPVYDHCGRVIDWTTSTLQEIQQKSIGAAAQSTAQPGMTGLAESGIVVTSPPATTTNLNISNSIKVVPNSSIGKTGDKKGDIATDSSYIYIANADYDGTTAIWLRASLSSW